MNKYKWFAIIVSIIVLVLSSAPVIYFSLYPKDDLIFLGRRYTNSQDSYTYISFIEQAKQGHNLFKNLYTSEDQSYSLLRPSYLLIGKIASLTNTNSLTSYHLSRVVFCVIFLFVLWKFLGYFAQDDKSKFVLYTLILTSSGLGFLVSQWLPNSIDLWVPESNTFFSLGEAPHFILSQLLMLAGFGSFLAYLKTPKTVLIASSILAFLALSFEHPFNLVVIVPILFVVCLWQKLSWLKTILIPLAAGLGLIYQYYLTLSNPILSAWQSQNLLLTPIPLLVFSGYGFLLILAVVGTEKILKLNKLTTSQQLVITWAVITAISLYLPFNFQRRLIDGFHIPLTILAGIGLTSMISHFKLKTQNLLLWIVILFLSATSVFMTYVDFRQIGQDTSNNYYYYLHKDELVALNWLVDNSSEEDIVLSNWYLGNLIPGLTGRQVYLGHQVQTIDSDKKTKELDRLLSTNTPDAFADFLRRNQIKYLFFGRNDSMFNSGFNPNIHPEINRVYDHNGVQIYQVN